MTNKTRQIIVVVAVFVIAIASLSTVIGLLVNTGQLSEYSNGFRYELNGSRATITGYDGTDEDVVVPDRLKGNRVVGIDKAVFYDLRGTVKSIKFNNTYSSFSIESEAFKGLTSLEKVVLPSNLKVIPSEAFSGCTSLKSVIIPNSVTEIGENAFKGCTSLNFMYNSETYTTEGAGAIKTDAMYLPTSLLEIGSYAFDGCTAIVEVHMSKDLEKIGSYAFNGCTKFSDFELEDDSEITSIGDWAFYNTILLSSQSLPLTFPNLVSVGANAFKSVKTNFSYFKLPSTVKTIGEYAFADCTSMGKIEIAEDAQIETMGEGVFQGCTQLTDVTLPTDLKEIPAKTFMGCYRLLYNNDFVIQKSVETIGDGAFAIYTGRGTNISVTTYSRHVIKVDEENENFAIVQLEDNARDNVTTSKYQQGLLTDSEGKTVYAYFGSYDGASTNSMGRTFRFLDVEGNFITSINTIKAYAFAGVDFEYIQLPTTIKEVEDYVFYGSKITACYTSAVGWSLSEFSFSTAIDGEPIIDVLLLKTITGVEEFLTVLGEYNVNAGTYSGTLQ